MGHQKGAGVKGQPIYTDNAQTQEDFQAAVDYAAKVGNVRVGTTAERDAATGKDVWEGQLWSDTDDGILYRRTDDSGGIEAIFGGLPAPNQANYHGVCAVTATSFADLPNLGSITLDLPAPAWVLLTFGAWMAASTGNCRVGIAVSGATFIAPSEDGLWGEVIYVQSLAGVSQQAMIAKTRLLNAGSNTITAQAYHQNATNPQANYPVLEAVPLRFA